MRSPARVTLANLPTPLVRAPRLSEAIGIEVLLKRDDLTGLALGGNKARSVEFHVGAAEEAGADVLVTGGGPRSSWVLTAAVGAAARGLAVELVMFGDRPPPGRGSLELLDRLDGGKVTFTGDRVRSSVDPMLVTLEEQLRSSGHHPYVVGRGGADAVGAFGYLSAVDELEGQLGDRGVVPRTLWLSTGSCGTQAGLLAGYRRSPGGTLIVGASVHRPVDECEERIRTISEAALDLAGVEERYEVSWELLDERDADPGEVETAAAVMARTEGILLDPEFGSPALAALMREASQVEGPVVFLVTGGTLNLFYGSSAASAVPQEVGLSGRSGSFQAGRRHAGSEHRVS